MKKARICLLGLVLFCSACAAPSLRYKKEMSSLLAAEKYQEAEELLVSKKNKLYSRKDAPLFYLDRALVAFDAGDIDKTDQIFSGAQMMIETSARSVSGEAGRLFINDLTPPYYAPAYEQALTYYYRALNFLRAGNVSAAAVEARRAVFFLDHLRGQKKQGYNDDPFVQYFASLVFESAGQRSDARIARTNALNAYRRLGAKLNVTVPDFPVPSNAAELGEIIFIHSNGLMPLKRNATFQVAWDRALVLASSAAEGDSVSPEVQNAINAGLSGGSVTLSFPEFVDQAYSVKESWLEIGGQRFYTQKVADLAASAKLDLNEKMPAILFRTATRAVSKAAASKAVRELVTQSSKDDSLGDLAGMLAGALGAAVEKADTRQWFTLPAEIRMVRAFVPPEIYNIRLLLRDGYGNIVGERVFENVRVQRGRRIFLHFRTAY